MTTEVQIRPLREGGPRAVAGQLALAEVDVGLATSCPMLREPIYPVQDTHFELLQPGGAEVVWGTRTEKLSEVTRLLEAAETFGYGVEVLSYYRHDTVDLFTTATMEWSITVWRVAADRGFDVEQAVESYKAADRHDRRTAAGEPLQVAVECEGAGQPVIQSRSGAAMCKVCSREDISTYRGGGRGQAMASSHAADVPADSEQAQRATLWPEVDNKPRRGLQEGSTSIQATRVLDDGSVAIVDEPLEDEVSRPVPPAARKPRRAASRASRTAARAPRMPALPPPSAPQPPVTVRCPGSGKSVQLDKPTPPRCPSCRREDLEVPRFSPTRSFGLLPAHGKAVPADSPEATLPRWDE